MRLFIALTTPEWTATVRWPRPPERHLTLRFLGERDPEELPGLEAALDRSAAATAPFDVVYRGGGAFPAIERPRVVWIGVGAGGAELRELARRLDQELARAGVPPESRPFVPHVTVLRVRGPSDRDRARELLRELEGRELGKARVEEIVLFESELTPQGALHRPHRRVPLSGGPPRSLSAGGG